MTFACPTGTRAVRLARVAALTILAAAAGAGCMRTAMREPPPAQALAAVPTGEAEARTMSGVWGERHRANPADPVTAINYAQALRTLGQRAQAASVLEQASIKHPRNMELLGA